MSQPSSIAARTLDAEAPARRPRTAPLRVGVVGCGAVAERYHLPAILGSSEVQIVAFADPDAARAGQLAARVPGAQTVRDHRALIGMADAAIVTAPNAWHAPIAADLLAAGVHVLVEKPMGRTVAECGRMRAAAAEGRAVLAVGHDFRFFPVAQAAHRLLAGGLLGAVRRADVRQSAGVRWPCVSPSALTPESGGGVLLSFGVHTVDLLLWWLGGLTPVSYADDACGGVESECSCELVTDGGAPVHLEVSRRRSLRETAIVECDRGRLEIAVFEPAFIRLTLEPGAPPLDMQIADAEFDAAPLRTVFTRQLRDFVAAIDDARAPLVDGEAGQRVVSVVERCYAMKRPLRRPWDYPESLTALRRTT